MTSAHARDLKIYWQILADPRAVAAAYDVEIRESAHGVHVDANAASRALDDALSRVLVRMLSSRPAQRFDQPRDP